MQQGQRAVSMADSRAVSGLLPGGGGEESGYPLRRLHGWTLRPTIWAKCPEKFDVIVASNQYGDILSDLGGRTGCFGAWGWPGGNVGKNGEIVVEAFHGQLRILRGEGSQIPLR